MSTSSPDEVSTGNSIAGSRALKGILLAVFCLGLLAVIPSAARFHGDERFYTDASIQMVKTGDYWTPYFADGRIRLLKPILTYWATAGSFQIFGINLFAARLPFLIAGALLIFLTYQLARAMLNSRRTALLAALILASNVEVLTLSTRATPDALLCVFVLMSMWGFARVWFQGDKTFVGPLLAFGGLGLAVQTKGLLGLCPLAVVVLFVLVAKPDRARTKKLLNWPAIVIGIALGIFWYAVMLQRHGAGALRDFFDDQVGEKVTRSAGFIIGNFAAYLFAGFRHFLPWTLLALVAAVWKRRDLAGHWRRHKAECVFLLGLFVMLVVVFSLGNLRRARYLTAAYPMLAVFLASALSGLATRDVFQKWLRYGIVVFAMALAVAGTGLLAVGFIHDGRLVAGGVVFLMLGIAGIISTRKADEIWRWLWMAGAMFAAFVVFGVSLRPVFSPTPLPLVANALMQKNLSGTFIQTWQISAPQAGQIRLLSDGKLTLSALGTNADLPDFSVAEIVVTMSPHQLLFEQAGYRLEEIKITNALLTSIPSLARWLREDDVKGVTTSYWIALKPDAKSPVR